MLRTTRLCTLGRLRRRVLTKRHISLSGACHIIHFGFTSHDRILSGTIPGYIVTLPELPEQSVESNIFLSSISRNADWPPLESASAAEYYEGTLKLLMDYSVNIHDHYQKLTEEREKSRFDGKLYVPFEQMLEPLLADEYDIDYAYNTLMLKMLTDWPHCSTNDWKCDYLDILALRAKENLNKTTYGAWLYMWVEFYTKEFNKIREERKEKGELVESIHDIEKDLDKVMPYWGRKLVEYYHRGYVTNGMKTFYEASPKHRARSGLIKQRTHMQRMEYLKNIMQDNRQPVYLITDKSLLKHAPPHVLYELAVDKDNYEETEYEVTLTPQKLAPFFRYCGDRRLRTAAWKKWTTIAGWGDDMNICNGLPIDRIIRESYYFSQINGFKNPADLRFSNRMAGSYDAVRQFIDMMFQRFYATFISRYDRWVDYGESHELISGIVNERDLFYVCRRESEAHYKVDFLFLMKHFPFWQTFDKISSIIEQIFNLRFEDVTTKSKHEICHPTCRVYAVSDQSTGQHLGRLYIDPFLRPNKRCGWKTILGRMQSTQRGLDKIVYLIGAGTPPDQDGNSFLHYEQLQSLLFHLGRSLQLLLSESPYREIAIPWEPQYYAWGGDALFKDEYAMDWDAVDMFPEFMRFFVYRPAMLSEISSPHAITEMPLTEEKAEAPASALQRSAFWEAYRCLFWSDFDLTVFSMNTFKDRYWKDIYKQKYEKYFNLKVNNQIQLTNFTPIFSSPVFHASYYRKLWTEMLAMDIHARFDQENCYDETGERFKNTILKKGAGEKQDELYMRFMGRNPSVGEILDFYTNPVLSITEEERRKLQAGKE